MEPTEWTDRVRERLYDERVVSCSGHLDDAAVSDLAATLWSLDAIDDSPITLLCSMSGGTVQATATLVDVLDVIGVEVRMLCIGAIVGPPVGLLAAAHERLAAPHARFVLRDERVAFAGSYRELEAEAARHAAQRQELLARLASSTRGRRSLGDVIADVERGRVLAANEALAYGLIDRVTPERPRLAVLPRPAPGFGFRPGDR